MTDLPDLNPAYLLDISGGDAELIGEILEVFQEDVPPRLDEIAAAMEAGEIDEVARIAHSLKGAAGSLGAERLQQLASELEVVAKAGDLARARVLIDPMRGALIALQERIDTERWGA